MDTALSIEPAVSGCVDSNDVPPILHLIGGLVNN